MQKSGNSFPTCIRYFGIFCLLLAQHHGGCISPSKLENDGVVSLIQSIYVFFFFATVDSLIHL
jgi:hypothetical protein